MPGHGTSGLNLSPLRLHAQCVSSGVRGDCAPVESFAGIGFAACAQAGKHYFVIGTKASLFGVPMLACLRGRADGTFPPPSRVVIMRGSARYGSTGCPSSLRRHVPRHNGVSLTVRVHDNRPAVPAKAAPHDGGVLWERASIRRSRQPQQARGPGSTRSDRGPRSVHPSNKATRSEYQSHCVGAMSSAGQRDALDWALGRPGEGTLRTAPEAPRLSAMNETLAESAPAAHSEALRPRNVGPDACASGSAPHCDSTAHSRSPPSAPHIAPARLTHAPARL